MNQKPPFCPETEWGSAALSLRKPDYSGVLLRREPTPVSACPDRRIRACPERTWMRPPLSRAGKMQWRSRGKSDTSSWCFKKRGTGISKKFCWQRVRATLHGCFSSGNRSECGVCGQAARSSWSASRHSGRARGGFPGCIWIRGMPGHGFRAGGATRHRNYAVGGR